MTPDSLLKNDSLWERELFLLTTELSGRPRPPCRGQTRPTMPHGPLERIVRHPPAPSLQMEAVRTTDRETKCENPPRLAIQECAPARCVELRPKRERCECLRPAHHLALRVPHPRQRCSSPAPHSDAGGTRDRSLGAASRVRTGTRTLQRRTCRGGVTCSKLRFPGRHSSTRPRLAILRRAACEGYRHLHPARTEVRDQKAVDGISRRSPADHL